MAADAVQGAEAIRARCRMTEAEWLACNSPRQMLDSMRGKLSDRKLRLFACACTRQVWDALRTDEQRNLVEVAEQYADGARNATDLVLAFVEVLEWGGEALPCGEEDAYVAAFNSVA